MRNWGARLRTDATFCGHRAVVLENEVLRVTILADRGADVVEFLHKPTDSDFCTFTRRGLRPPGESRGRRFMDLYYGGWQEIFPNGGAPCRFAGAELDQHAEVALLPWRVNIVRDSPEEVAVAFVVRCLQTPFRLRRVMRLAAGAALLDVACDATNDGAAPQPAMWGQHLAFGGPYARPGSRITLPEGARVVAHPGALALAYLWAAPPPGEPTSVTYLTGFSVGRYRLRDAARPVGLEVAWDAAVLPYLWCWREAGGTRGYPWYGREYIFGLEPFSSYPTDGLTTAVANGTALAFEPGESRTLRWSARVVG